MTPISGKPLKREALQAALETLIEKGIEAVKVDPIAKSLKITCGSFYWHFKNLDDKILTQQNKL